MTASRFAAMVAFAAGCYSPAPPTGVPCDDTLPAPCPEEQRCVAGACTTSGAPDDGPVADATMLDMPIDSIPADWVDLASSYRRRITITGPVAATLDNFPVLVTLDVGMPGTSPTGADLRFFSNAKPLPYEIDTWTATQHQVWVTAPQLAPLATPTIEMYWGNPDAAGTPDTPFADDTAVFHMTTFDDATGKGHFGSTHGTNPGVGAGKIGSARTFANNGGILLNGAEADFAYTQTMTASLWFKIATFNGAYDALVVKGNSTWRVQRLSATTMLSFDTTCSGLSNSSATATAVNDATWHHLGVVYSAAGKRILLDGVLEASDIVATAIDTKTDPVTIGYNAVTTLPRYMTGALDEIRLTSIARSDAWIAAEYRTVTDPGFVTLGAVETLP